MNRNDGQENQRIVNDEQKKRQGEHSAPKPKPASNKPAPDKNEPD